MSYTIEQIEDAIITAIDGLKESLNVRTIKSYQGELEEEEIKRLIVLFPAIFVVYGGSEYVENGHRITEVAPFMLFVCDKNLRAEEEARRGSGQNPGTYAMLRALREKLSGADLLQEIRRVKLKREVSIWFGKGISIYSAEYEIIQHYK